MAIALDGYDRLEAPGIWRAHPRDQRRDVTVAVGVATLAIYDRADVPLAHWSLPAVRRLNPGRTPARYVPGDDATEDLEIDDDLMIDAIETVRRAIDRRRPQHGRLRLTATLAAATLLGAAAVLWLPGALVRHTVSVAPPALRAQLGADLMTAMTPATGLPCGDAEARRALAALSLRLLGPGRGPLVVVRDGIATSAHLPGGTILVNRRLIEDYDTPEPLAGYVLAEAARLDRADPLDALLRDAGPLATLGLLTGGTMADTRLDDHAKAILRRRPEPVDAAALHTRFADAGIRATPYARTIDPTGETLRTLIEDDPVPPGSARAIIDDGRWVMLQGLCEP